MKYYVDRYELQEFPAIMTPNEVAEFLCLHVNTVYNLLKKGKIQGFRVGNSWRIKRDSLLRL